MLRGIEVFLVAMRSDMLYAEVVADRNIRYARTYGHHTGDRSSMVFLQSIRSLIKIIPNDDSKAARINEQFQSKQIGPVFRMMFSQLYRQYFPAH
jgi:hypothetical protein